MGAHVVQIVASLAIIVMGLLSIKESKKSLLHSALSMRASASTYLRCGRDDEAQECMQKAAKWERQAWPLKPTTKGS